MDQMNFRAGVFCMNNQLCLVSRCVLVTEREAHFHFKGYFLGQKITKVIIKPKSGKFCPEVGNFRRGEDYVLFLKIAEVCNTILITNHLKSKHLSLINF